MARFLQYTFFVLMAMIMMIISTAESATIHHKYHHQVRMQIYSKPNYSGQVQTIRASQDHGKNHKMISLYEDIYTHRIYNKQELGQLAITFHRKG